MNPDTKFALDLSHSSVDVKEVKDFLEKHRAEPIRVFSEDITHRYDEAEKTPMIQMEGSEFRFTSSAYYQFCQLVGLPTAFAMRIPAGLAQQNMEVLLDGEDSRKIQFMVRDTNVICGAFNTNHIHTEPLTFFDSAAQLLKKQLFREASISDWGTSFLFEPGTDSTIEPVTGDSFNIGMGFQVGFSSGRIQADPYSLRHCCLNIAITASEFPRYRLLEKLKAKPSNLPYSRIIENYEGGIYQHLMKELSERLAAAMSLRMTDETYVNTFNGLQKVVGKEISLHWLDIEKEQHDEIVSNFKLKEDGEAPIDLEKDQYESFNRITAAAKGYTGMDRIKLQEIGGRLI